MASPKSYCTDQEMEIVVIDGSEFQFLDWHLNSFWEKAPEFDVQSTSNWAGYTAKWEIKDGKLWLTAFSAKLKGKVVEPKDVFHAELPIHATWVNGPSYAAKKLNRTNSTFTARDVERVFFVDGIVHKRSHIESANVNWGRLGIGFENTGGKLTIFSGWRKSDGPLFRSQRGGNMTAGSMVRMLKQLYCEAGLPDASSHTGRRTFITSLAEKGIDLKAIATLAGHTNIRTTALYVEANPQRLSRILSDVSF